jgi:hypothetical protein
MADLLGMFGGASLGISLDGLDTNNVAILESLRDQYMATAMMGGAYGAGTVPPFLGIPSPMSAFPMMMPLCGAGYAGAFPTTIDLAPGSTNIPFFSQLFDPNRRMAAMFERMLQSNPYARAAFESQLGGRVCDWGGGDGTLTVQRYAPGFAPIPGMAFNPLANSALGYMSCMDSAVLAQAAALGAGGSPYSLSSLYGGNPFNGFVTAGLAGIASGVPGGPQVPYNPGAAGTIGVGSPNSWGFGALQAPLGGQGYGSWNPQAMPGQINNTNPLYEQAHQAEIDAVLRDPSLTVEDKVTLMIMLIMKKMDDDIERQAQYINSIQQQQSNQGNTDTTGGGGKGKGGPVGGQTGTGNQSSPSIDVETMKLKRMIDKRSQMFDMLRQIIDKYNQTAKGIIDAIGR